MFNLKQEKEYMKKKKKKKMVIKIEKRQTS